MKKITVGKDLGTDTCKNEETYEAFLDLLQDPNFTPEDIQPSIFISKDNHEYPLSILALTVAHNQTAMATFTDALNEMLIEAGSSYRIVELDFTVENEETPIEAEWIELVPTLRHVGLEDL